MSTNHLDNRAGNLRYVERWLNELGEPNRAVALDHDRRIAGRGVSSGGRKKNAYALRKLDGHTHGVPWTEVTAARPFELFPHGQGPAGGCTPKRRKRAPIR